LNIFDNQKYDKQDFDDFIAIAEGIGVRAGNHKPGNDCDQGKGNKQPTNDAMKAS